MGIQVVSKTFPKHESIDVIGTRTLSTILLLREKFPYSEFFWSVFVVYLVRIRRFSGRYSVQMLENTDQKNSEYGHFSRGVWYHWNKMKEGHLQCVKIVCIRSYSSAHFPAFRLNTNSHRVSLGIQSKCGKMRTRIAPNRDTFHAVLNYQFIRFQGIIV